MNELFSEWSTKKNEKHVLREALKKINDTVEARGMGCVIKDYELYRKQRFNNFWISYILTILIFTLGVLFGRGLI